MRCSKCRSLYTAYRDDGLTTRQRSDVEKHIDTCERCRSVYSGMDQIVRTCSTLPRFEVSEDLSARLLARIRASEAVPSASIPFSRWLTPRLAYGALLMAVFAVCGFLLLQRMGRMETPIAELDAKERVYSLGVDPGLSEIVIEERDYSLGHITSSEDIIYSLPIRSSNVKPASY